MAESHELGQKGEEKAVAYLKDKGYKILFRNWKWGKNEIDIIAENKSFIVFVEVKSRAVNPVMDPATAVTNEKQKSILRAADGYLQRFKIDKESRFDILTVIIRNNNFEINHIEDAFYATLK